MNLTESEIMGDISYGDYGSPYFAERDYSSLAKSINENLPAPDADPNAPYYYFPEKPLARLNTNNPFAQRIDFAEKLAPPVAPREEFAMRGGPYRAGFFISYQAVFFFFLFVILVSLFGLQIYIYRKLSQLLQKIERV